MIIDREHLTSIFTLLCETDSPSRKERKIASLLKEIFSELGADEILEDDTAQITGSDSGNLFIKFNGTGAGEGVFLNCHMDTVEPANGVKVVREGDTFFSEGDTILGSDDKSGIAAVIEAVRFIRHNSIDHPPFEIILTTCEEVGLLGAKALDPSMIHARTGYSLDSTGFGLVIVGAPASNRLNITVRGAAAHAGLHPEWGINAISLAAKALTLAPQGRIDSDSTVNFGSIRGGTASNIVAEQVNLIGEVRSHSTENLDNLTNRISNIFTKVISDWEDPTGEARGTPEVEIKITPDFPIMKLSQNDEVIQRVEAAAKSINMPLEYTIAGGGSDANIFNGYGLQTAIIATGMTHVHSTDEQVDLQDMVDLSRLIVAIITNSDEKTGKK